MRADPIGFHKKEIRYVRAVFQQKGVTTRAERRECLRRHIDSRSAWRWLYEHPADAWTEEDEERGWSPMYADERAEMAAKAYEQHGYYREMVDDTTGPEKTLSEFETALQGQPPKQVELHQVQEHFFGKEWASGDGNGDQA